MGKQASTQHMILKSMRWVEGARAPKGHIAAETGRVQMGRKLLEWML